MNKRILKKYFMMNNISLHKLLNNILNDEIKKITYLGNYNMQKMPEYRFNLLKFNVVLQDFSNCSIFIRIINKNKIEENLFCYWLFCEEYFKVSTQLYVPKADVINVKSKHYEKRYKYQLLGKNNKISKSSFIDIVDINNYLKANLSIYNGKNINEYLFIAVI